MSADRIIDETDSAILTILQDNARTAQAEIARTVGLAPSAVLERMRKLEARGLVRGYAALLDPAALGHRLLAFMAVRTADRPGEMRLAAELAEMPEVLEVHHVAGDDCLVLKIRARDTEHLSAILRDRIGAIDGVRSTRTTVVLETIKETPRLPLPAAPAVGVPS